MLVLVPVSKPNSIFSVDFFVLDDLVQRMVIRAAPWHTINCLSVIPDLSSFVQKLRGIPVELIEINFSPEDTYFFVYQHIMFGSRKLNHPTKVTRKPSNLSSLSPLTVCLLSFGKGKKKLDFLKNLVKWCPEGIEILYAILTPEEFTYLILPGCRKVKIVRCTISGDKLNIFDVVHLFAYAIHLTLHFENKKFYTKDIQALIQARSNFVSSEPISTIEIHNVDNRVDPKDIFDLYPSGKQLAIVTVYFDDFIGEETMQRFREAFKTYDKNATFDIKPRYLSMRYIRKPRYV